MPTYIAAVSPGTDGYLVTFPDFPGLEANGTSLDAAHVNAQGVLEEHLATSFGETPSKICTLEDAVALRPGALLMALSVSQPKSRAVRINITIPEDLLTAVDRSAAAHGVSRSRLLAKAVEASITGKCHDGVQLPLRGEVLAAVDKAADAHGMNRLPFLSGVIEAAVGLRGGHRKPHGH